MAAALCAHLDIPLLAVLGISPLRHTLLTQQMSTSTQGSRPLTAAALPSLWMLLMGGWMVVTLGAPLSKPHALDAMTLLPAARLFALMAVWSPAEHMMGWLDMDCMV